MLKCHENYKPCPRRGRKTLKILIFLKNDYWEFCDKFLSEEKLTTIPTHWDAVGSMQNEILRNHCLWQKSWTGPPLLTPLSWSLTPRKSLSSRASNQTKESQTSKQVTPHLDNQIKSGKLLTTRCKHR